MARLSPRFSFSAMKVRECMAYGVGTADADESVRAAAERMRVMAVGCLPVISAGRLVGVITDRDIAVRCVAEGAPPETPVRRLMTPDVVTCDPDESLEAAVDHMVRGGVRRLVVIDRDLSVVGLISIDDVAIVDASGRLAGVVLARTVEKRGVEMNGLLT